MTDAKWPPGDRALAAGLAVVSAVLLYLTIGVFAQGWAARVCAPHGYAVRFEWTLTAYCVKRVDQTEQLVPLGALAP